MTDKSGEKRRLSNGPIEGYNRIPKDYKRNARGFENFESVRIRLIWSNKKNESILAIPKSKEEVYTVSKKRKKIKIHSSDVFRVNCSVTGKNILWWHYS